jgi:DNA-binding transcriptional regulator LsrR (DeoR family)
MAIRYREGATVYQLAVEFNIERRTVSDRLKKTGVRMRLQPPPDEVIDQMVQLYELGLSIAAVGKQYEVSPQTVRRYLKLRGLNIRDPHWRAR